MNTCKEYYEILDTFKDVVNEKSFDTTSVVLSKEYIKSLLLSNPLFAKSLNNFKEKQKNIHVKNKNVFYLIKNGMKKNQKENRLILNSLTNFSVLYNEPGYIKELNDMIYNRIATIISDLSRNIKLLSLVNGKNVDFKINEDMLDTVCSKKMTPTKVLNMILKVKNPNLRLGLESKFGFKTKILDVDYVKSLYDEIILNSNESCEDTINSKKRRDLITNLIKENKKQLLLETLKMGVPDSMRKSIYQFLMGIDLSETHNTNTDDNFMLLDYFLLDDIQMTVSNENYFLFEEIIKKTLKKLLRDRNLLHEIQGIRPIIIAHSQETEEDCIYPYSGFFPMSGLGYQCAPFSYMSINPNEIYAVLRSFFAKYLSHLSSYTTNNNSILFLIYNFQYYLVNYFSDLHLHFQKMGFDILEVVFEWFSFAFGSVIGPKEAFYLYDLIVISDNMIIFVYFAFGLLLYKKNAILNSNSKEEIKNTLDYLKFDDMVSYEILMRVKLYTDNLTLNKRNNGGSNDN